MTEPTTSIHKRHGSALRVCACGTRLSASNPDIQCFVCAKRGRDALNEPPQWKREFWTEPRIRAALLSRHMGKVIREYRRHPACVEKFGGSGLTQTQLAKWLNTSQSHISRLEKGSAPKNLEFLQFHAYRLAIPLDLLWFAVDLEENASRNDFSDLAGACDDRPESHTTWKPQSVLENLTQTTKMDLSYTRRQALEQGASALLVGTSLTSPLQNWLLPDLRDDSSGKPSAEMPWLNSDLRDLNETAYVWPRARKWIKSQPARIARKLAIAQLNDFVEILLNLHSPSGRAAGFAIASDMSTLVASLSWDSALHRSAQTYYVKSLQLAKSAGDNLLSATVLADLARQSCDLGHPDDGLEMVQLARYGTRRARPSNLDSLLATREAWAHAARRDSQGFLRAASMAEELCNSSGADHNDPRAVRDFDLAELAGTLGGRLRDLSFHDPRHALRAAAYTERALALRHPDQVKNRLLDTISLARILLVTGDLERSCTLIHSAIPAMHHAPSGRARRKLLDFYGESAKYASVREIHDTRERIEGLNRPR